MLSKMRGMGHYSSLLIFISPPHAVLDVVIDDEIQFFVGEAVVSGEYAVYFIDDGFTYSGLNRSEL